MKYYVNYMDRQTVSPALHEALLDLEAPRPKRHWQSYAALAACLAVVVGLGVWRWTAKVPEDSNDAVDILSKIGVLGDGCAHSDELPDLSYPETNTGEMAADIALPDGAMFRDMTGEQIAGILGEDLSVDLERYAVTGQAIYDGYGTLWQADLRGTAENGDSFYIELASGDIPPTCVVFLGGEVTEVCGVEVQDWGRNYDSNGDGVAEHHYNSAFIAHGVGIRASFTSVEDNTDSTLFIYRATDVGLTLEHIAQLEDVPDFRSVWFRDGSDYSEVLKEADFLPYLPQSVPEGFGEFGGKLVYQEGIDHHLVVWWRRGSDSIHLYLTLPEGGAPDTVPVDIDAPETWDLRRHGRDRWDEGLSYEVLNTLEFPTFRAEDMTREVVEARQDTTSWQFQVLHPDGTAVEYSIYGLTADEVWSMVEATL